MRVLITRVEPKVIKEDPSFISSFRIFGLLKSGKEVRMFANKIFDLRNYVNQELNLLIKCKLTNISEDIRYDPYHPFFEGEYLGKSNISDKWNIDWVFEPKNSDDLYHSIKINDGILLIRPSNLNRYYSVKQGEIFKFKTAGFDLMAWEQAEGDNEIESLTYEKTILKKFWNLMRTTREKSKHNSEIQKELIYQELLNWTYDEISLFSYIKARLESRLQLLNVNFKKIFGKHMKEGFNFVTGVITLGKQAVIDAFSNPLKLSEDIEAGLYSEPIEKIRSYLNIVQSVMEEKSGHSIDKVESSFVRKDIEEVRDRIYKILDNELNITN